MAEEFCFSGACLYLLMCLCCLSLAEADPELFWAPLLKVGVGDIISSCRLLFASRLPVETPYCQPLLNIMLSQDQGIKAEEGTGEGKQSRGTEETYEMKVEEETEETKDTEETGETEGKWRRAKEQKQKRAERRWRGAEKTTGTVDSWV